MTPTPIELDDPWLGEQLQLICSGKHEVIKALRFRNQDVEFIPKPITVAKVGRNDPCPYCAEEGVKIKFKKCSVHNK